MIRKTNGLMWIALGVCSPAIASPITVSIDLKGVNHIAPLNYSQNQRFDVDLSHYGERLYLKSVIVSGTLRTFAGSWADDIGIHISSTNSVSNSVNIFPAAGIFQSGPGIGVGPYQRDFHPNFSLSPEGLVSFVFFDDFYDVAGQPDATWQSGSFEIIFDNCFPSDLVDPYGTRDFFDVSRFLELFQSGNLEVDFTEDGNLDFFDVSLFLNAFTSGCP